MTTSLNEKIQNIIFAVQRFKAYIIADNIARNDDINEKCDWYSETFGYYKSLKLPDGMNYSKACFEAVLSYPIETTSNTSADMLSKFKFGF